MTRTRNIRTTTLFFVIFFSVFGGIVGALYYASGELAVPAASPLADPSYVIEPLPDVTLPRDAVVPPGIVTPVNQLYGGKNWRFSLIFELAVLIWISLITAVFAKNYVLKRLIFWAAFALIELNILAQTLFEIPFYYGCLRSSAQAFINGSHRWRVILAYIELWCSQSGQTSKRAATLTMLPIYLVSLACASLVAYTYHRISSATEQTRTAP